MVTNRGNATAYSSASGHRPIPTVQPGARQLHGHQPRERRTGLDWDAHRPSCSGCGEKSSELDNTDRCPTCRGETIAQARARRKAAASAHQLDDGEVARRFTAPTRDRQNTPEPAQAAAGGLSGALADLEATDPAVAAAAAALDDATHRITHPEDHARPTPMPGPTQSPADGHAPAAGSPTGRGSEREVAPVPPAGLPQQGPTEQTPPADGLPADVAQILTAAERVAASLRELAEWATSVADTFTTAIERAQTPTSHEPTTASPAPRPAVAGTRTAAAPARPPTLRSHPRSIDVADAKRLLEDGLTVPQIAERLGCAVSTARRALRGAGVVIPDGRATRSGGRLKTTEDDDPQVRDEVTRRYTVGDSTDQIALDLGLSRKYVLGVLRRAGVTIRPSASAASRATSPDIDANEVAARYRAGHSIADIARDFGVRRGRVREVLQAASVPVRSRGDSTHLVARLEQLGVTNHQVKQWAVDQGLLDALPRGRVAGHLVDAWEAAHPTDYDEEEEQR